MRFFICPGNFSQPLYIPNTPATYFVDVNRWIVATDPDIEWLGLGLEEISEEQANNISSNAFIPAPTSLNV